MLLVAWVVWLTVLLQIGAVVAVSLARRRHGIRAPATTGHPAFERVYRVQGNTTESTLAFLPALWLTAQYASATLAGIVGLIWVVSRAWYGVAYAREGGRRGPPYIISMVAVAILIVAAAVGMTRAML